MESFLTINTFAWVVVIFFAGGWTFGLTKKQYNTRNTRMIVLWWWLCIGAIIFLKLSPFFLFALMPLAAILSVVIPGLIGSIILAGSIFLINHFF